MSDCEVKRALNINNLPLWQLRRRPIPYLEKLILPPGSKVFVECFPTFVECFPTFLEHFSDFSGVFYRSLSRKVRAE